MSKKAKGIRGVLLQDCTKVTLRGRGDVNRVPSRRRHVQYLTIDYGDQIKELQETLEQVTAELRTIQKKEREVHNAQKKFETKVQTAVKLYRTTGKAIQKNREKLDELSKPEDDDPSNVADEIEVIREQIEDLNSQINDKKSQEAKVLEEAEKFTSTVKELKQNHQQKYKRLTAIQNERREIQDSYEIKLREVHRMKKEKESIMKKLKKYQDMAKCFEQDVAEMQTEVDLLVTEASKLMDRPKGRLDLRKITSKVKGLEKRLEKEKSEHGDPIQAEREYKRAFEKLRDAQKETLDAKMLLDEETKVYKKRKQEWQEYRRELECQTGMCFNYYLTTQGFSGRLNFNDNTKGLELEVIPPSSQTNEKTVTKALSGGEKSFTTISFIMALGDFLHTPFRAMDEFDIFMDSVNRKVSMNLLVNVASDKMENQFIFLTPQDINGIPKKPNIRILKLSPPDRNQGNLSGFVRPVNQ